MITDHGNHDVCRGDQEDEAGDQQGCAEGDGSRAIRVPRRVPGGHAVWYAMRFGIVRHRVSLFASFFPTSLLQGTVHGNSGRRRDARSAASIVTTLCLPQFVPLSSTPTRRSLEVFVVGGHLEV